MHSKDQKDKAEPEEDGIKKMLKEALQKEFTLDKQQDNSQLKNDKIFKIQVILNINVFIIQEETVETETEE